MILATKNWSVKFDLLLALDLRRSELSLVISISEVPLSDQLRYQFLNLIVAYQVLSNLVDNVVADKAIERIRKLIVDVFFVLASF